MPTLLPEDILSLTLRLTQAPGDLLPIGLEYRGEHGLICPFYLGRLAPSAQNQEALAPLRGLGSLLLRQDEERRWLARFYSAVDPECFLEAELCSDFIQQVFDRLGLQLPAPAEIGRPSPSVET